MEEKEIWLPILGFDGKYEISSFGRVKSVFAVSKLGKKRLTGTILKLSINKRGYYIVKLSKKTHKPHRLVALAFHANPENKPQVNHKDLNPLNNHKDNLEWVTGQQNMDHYYASGRVKRRKPKLSNEDVIFIRKNFWVLGIDKLAEKFSTHRAYIYAIGTGRKRLDVDFKPACDNIGSRKIILHTGNGVFYESPQELASLLGVQSRSIWRRLNGERPNNTPYKYV